MEFDPQYISTRKGQATSPLDEPVIPHTHNGIDSPLLSGSGGGIPAGSDKDIQFNDQGYLGGDDNFQWDKTTRTLSIGDANYGIGIIQGPNASVNSGDNGTDVDIIAGNGSTGTSTGDGGVVLLQGGQGDAGGDVELDAGVGLTDDGGEVKIFGGSTSATNGGRGGGVTIYAGNSGPGTDAEGGRLDIGTGNGDGSANGGDLRIVLGSGGSTAQRPGFIQILCQPYGQQPVERIQQVNAINTTDATPTTLLSIDTNNFRAYHVEARVIGHRTGGSAGTNHDSASYLIIGTFKATSLTTVSQVGSTMNLYSNEDQVGWDVNFVISADKILVQVTGAVNNDITWTGWVEHQLSYLTN
jgi:hypothetical protein